MYGHCDLTLRHGENQEGSRPEASSNAGEHIPIQLGYEDEGN